MQTDVGVCYFMWRFRHAQYSSRCAIHGGRCRIVRHDIQCNRQDIFWLRTFSLAMCVGQEVWIECLVFFCLCYLRRACWGKMWSIYGRRWRGETHYVDRGGKKVGVLRTFFLVMEDDSYLQIN